MDRRRTKAFDGGQHRRLRLQPQRNAAERAGIVVLEPLPEQLTVLAASLFNHGVTAKIRATSARISVHAGTTEETLDMLRAALTSYASAA